MRFSPAPSKIIAIFGLVAIAASAAAAAAATTAAADDLNSCNDNDNNSTANSSFATCFDTNGKPKPYYSGPTALIYCDGCPVASTAAEIDAVNARYDSEIARSELTLSWCLEDFAPEYRDLCQYHATVERQALEYMRGNYFAAGSEERERTDAEIDQLTEKLVQELEALGEL